MLIVMLVLGLIVLMLLLLGPPSTADYAYSNAGSTSAPGNDAAFCAGYCSASAAGYSF